MTTMKKWCTWSKRALEARAIFTPEELKEINREAKRNIEHFFTTGEGYHTTSIPFDKFACGFLLIYSFEDEYWILDLIDMPPDGPQDPRRKRRRRRNGYERVIEDFVAGLRQALADVCGALSACLYNMVIGAGPRIAAFWADDAVWRAWNDAMEPIGPTNGDVTTSRLRVTDACAEVVQLVRGRCKTSLTFLGSMWTLEPSHGGDGGDLRWDIEWFGPLPEQVST